MATHPAIDPSVLGCIVTGFAKGGTTLLKDLLVQTTDMVGRFEGGMLLVDSPAEGIPEPHAGNIDHAWKPVAGFHHAYRRCRTFEEGYRLLRESSTMLVRHDAPLVDKLPQYLVCLADVMRRAPGTPVVVVVRDPLHVAVSWLALGNSMAGTASWLATASESLLAVIADRHRPSPLYLLAFADLLHDVDATLAPLQAWLGRPHQAMPEGRRYGLPYVQAGRHRLPRAIEHDRHELADRCTPREQERIRGELHAAAPQATAVASLRSGPVDGPARGARAA